jgi:hypothetical protein
VTISGVSDGRLQFGYRFDCRQYDQLDVSEEVRSSKTAALLERIERCKKHWRRQSTSSYTMSLEAFSSQPIGSCFIYAAQKRVAARIFYRYGSLSRGSDIRSAIRGGLALSPCLVANDAIPGCVLTAVPCNMIFEVSEDVA